MKGVKVIELRRFLVVWLIVILFMGFFLFVVKPFTDFSMNSQVTVEEDDPRWDCRTMGNGVCGNE
jgi:hypothetical protein